MICRALPATLLVAALVQAQSVRVRVATDDGLPVPVNTAAELHCSGGWLSEATVEPAGSVILGAVPQDQDCKLEVRAAGYGQASVELENLPLDPRIPGIALRRLAKHQGESISASHLAAPDSAVASYHAAIRLMQQGGGAQPDAILSRLIAATEAYPSYASAWHEIGRMRLALGDATGAAQAFDRAIEADPWFVSPYEPLILVLRALGRPEEAEVACQGLRRINSALPADCTDAVQQ